MGAPKNKPLVLKAFLVERDTGRVVASKTFRNRLPYLLIVKLSAWVFALEDEYPRERYRLMVSLEGGEDQRTEFLRNKFRELGITVVEEPLKVVV